METVFDHNITEKEWKRIYSDYSKESYLKHPCQEIFLRDIATLYYIRGNKEMATAYANRLPPDTKNDLWRTLTHP